MPSFFLTFCLLEVSWHPTQAQAYSIDPDDSPIVSSTANKESKEPDPISEVARQNLRDASNACRRYGWLAFWGQLILTTVAAIIVLFSMAFTSQAGPQVSLYLTLFSIAMGYLSTFWSYGYTRLSRRLRAFLDAATDFLPSGAQTAPATPSTTASKPTRGVRRSEVIGTLEKGAIINALGAAASLLALQATIGLLVAKTLTTASVNPFLASSSNSWNPVLAFDVFNVQATTNSLLSHFFSLLISLWLLRIVANRPSAARVMTKVSSPS